jgi:hypothetical protein
LISSATSASVLEIPLVFLEPLDSILTSDGTVRPTGDQRRPLSDGDHGHRSSKSSPEGRHGVDVDGKRIDAAEAVRLGLINRHVTRDRLDSEVDSLARNPAKKAPMAMKLGLEGFYRMQDMSFPAAIGYLENQLALLSRSDDVKEGVTAFFEKREARFTGR